MKTLVFLTLCSVLTLGPVASRLLPGLCELQKLHDELFCNGSLIGSYCPQCDAQGNFLPQQCWSSTGYCWCVDVVSGKEIPGTSTPPTARRVNCDELERWSCPDGWSNFQQTCFSFINTPKKWIEAEVYCQFDGGSLASIHSKEENHFIMSLTRGFTNNFPQTWLGGFDAIHPGYWMWSDGSDFNYENWYDNPRGEEGGDEGDEGDEGDGGDHGNEGDEGDGGHKGDGGHEGDGGHHGNKGGDGDDGDDGDEGDEGDEGDDLSHKPQSNDDCLKMNYDYDLKWFHGSCTKRLPFVCAKQAHRAPH